MDEFEMPVSPPTRKRSRSSTGIVGKSAGDPAGRMSLPLVLPRDSLSLNPHCSRIKQPVEASSPYDQARARLDGRVHVKPIGRESEYEKIYQFINRAVRGTRGNLLATGVVGSGKTFVVTTAIVAAHTDHSHGVGPDFRSLAINLANLKSPTLVFTEIWHFLSGVGERLPPVRARAQLSAYFQSPQVDTRPLILFLDEIDFLLRKSEAFYSLIQLPADAVYPLGIVIATNDMGIEERIHHRILSRATWHHVRFQPYTASQLKAIVLTRLESSLLIEEKAIELAAKRQANSTGDCRKVLQNCSALLSVAERRWRRAGCPEHYERATPKDAAVAETSGGSAIHIQTRILKGLPEVQLLTLVAVATELYYLEQQASGGMPLSPARALLPHVPTSPHRIVNSSSYRALLDGIGCPRAASCDRTGNHGQLRP
eukprot:NODE_1160_length_1667_cov_55.915946_g1029_i0.p1 GENE.NODE_1160_length_1667_cov_55.915946_g1029_i0~~NODE_1160_length_1667_cov_55.915946_g1029_i0.p1  ORF type:complete len:427 (+),score=33.74 NODE_1160_length_1667_cov_55.915946_g1029_i0:92-1372(+)